VALRTVLISQKASADMLECCRLSTARRLFQSPEIFGNNFKKRVDKGFD